MGLRRRAYSPVVTRARALALAENDAPNCSRATTSKGRETPHITAPAAFAAVHSTSPRWTIPHPTTTSTMASVIRFAFIRLPYESISITLHSGPPGNPLQPQNLVPGSLQPRKLPLPPHH